MWIAERGGIDSETDNSMSRQPQKWLAEGVDPNSPGLYGQLCVSVCVKDVYVRIGDRK